MTELIETPGEVRERVRTWVGGPTTVGFVPTMGALHEGHRRLMQHAVRENDRTVVSRFVNPTQFESPEAADAYPRHLEADLRILESESVDVLFSPPEGAMYPEGDCTSVHVDGPMTEGYEARFRPGFFEGVARVVSKLFNIVPSDRAYFGEKDLQQLLMVHRLIQDLHFPQTLRPVPVVRDEDGVAFSSRNERFTEENWTVARAVYRIMSTFRAEASQRDREGFLEECRSQLRERTDGLDYADVVSVPAFEPCAPSYPTAVLVVACHIGEVRLKDNLPLQVEHVGELGMFEG